MRNRLLFLTLFTIFSTSVWAQTKIGGDPFTINEGSLLELEDTERGVLFPRIVLDDVTQWSLLGTPIDGMVVANEGGAVPEGLYNWNNGAWHIMAGITSETVTSIMGEFLNGVLT